MVFPSNRSSNGKKRILLDFLVVTFVASTLFLSCGLMNCWWLLWIVPIPIILLSLYETMPWSFGSAFLGYALGNSLVLAFYYYQTFYPWPSSLIYEWLDAIALAAIIMLNGIFIKKWRSALVLFFFPLAMVTYYYLLMLLGKGELFSLQSAFTQYPFLPLIQLVSLTGIWGICFNLALFPNALAICWYYRKEPKLWLPVAIITAIILLASLTYGTYLLYQPIARSNIRAAVLTNDLKNKSDFIAMLQNEIANPLATLANYENSIAELPKQGAQFILNTECALNINTKSSAVVMKKIAVIAKNKKVTLLFPICEFNQHKEQVANYMVAADPTGFIIAEYHKQHLIHPFEDTIEPGTKLSVIYHQNSKLGLAICHDMDFVNPPREYGKDNYGLLFVPAGDFGVNKDAWWHTRFALVLSIANGYSMVRTASYGFLTINDYRGRLIVSKASIPGKRVVAVATVPLSQHKTFYACYGDWFAYLSILGLILVLLGFSFRRNK